MSIPNGAGERARANRSNGPLGREPFTSERREGAMARWREAGAAALGAVLCGLASWPADARAVPGAFAPAAEPASIPKAARAAGVDERLGAAVPLDLPLVDHTASPTTLRAALVAGKPVLLVLAYYRCPMLCGLVLGGLADAVQKTGWTPGEDFTAVTISFDPRDTPAEAARSRTTTLSRASGERGDWAFLVGGEREVAQVADAVGFRYAYDPSTEQYAHPAVAIVLTPEGRVSRYLYGVRFAPRDIRLALVEAGAGRVGGIVDRVLLTCYRYDPASRRYAPFLRGFFRIGGALLATAVAALVGGMFWLERRRNETLRLPSPSGRPPEPESGAGRDREER